MVTLLRTQTPCQILRLFRVFLQRAAVRLCSGGRQGSGGGRCGRSVFHVAVVMVMVVLLPILPSVAKFLLHNG